MYKYDPSRTLTLRTEFVSQFKARLSAIDRASKVSIVDNDCFGLTGAARIAAQERPPRDWIREINPIPSGSFSFRTDPEKVKGFMEWLQEMEDAALFQIVRATTIGPGLQHPWTNMYISRAYQKGIIWASIEIKKNKELMKDLGLTPSDVDSSSQTAVNAFFSPVHADRAGVLFTRVFTDLKGITAAMDAAISRILTEGLVMGRSPFVIAREISKKIKTIGKHRATILARTEIIRAHHVASIQTYRSYGVLGIKVQAEWATARDARVCPLCEPLDGRIYTLDEIEPMIPLHPQCRCAALPVVID
jgi:SPP1 gp7 family putative phage head morphogenesis protein